MYHVEPRGSKDEGLEAFQFWPLNGFRTAQNCFDFCVLKQIAGSNCRMFVTWLGFRQEE
jgi:hypothetical protein